MLGTGGSTGGMAEELREAVLCGGVLCTGILAGRLFCRGGLCGKILWGGRWYCGQLEVLVECSLEECFVEEFPVELCSMEK